MLQAPWLAWEFCHMNNRAPLNNKPTVAGDKWSYATTVCEICEWGDLGIQRADAWNLSADLKQRYNGFDSGIARVVKIPEILTSTSSSIGAAQRTIGLLSKKQTSINLTRSEGCVL